MPRPPKSRKVSVPPKMQGFIPYGIATNEKESIALQFDEYESVKLVNYDGLPQDEAALKMEVSRPTLTRIYNSALQKIAKAFVEGKPISIGGGNFEFDNDWYRCKKCFKLIEGLENHLPCPKCDRFGKDELTKLNDFQIVK